MHVPLVRRSQECSEFIFSESKHKPSCVQLFTSQFLLVVASRAVDKGLDMTGGAEALVNKAGLDHVSRCSGELVSRKKIKKYIFIHTFMLT